MTVLLKNSGGVLLKNSAGSLLGQPNSRIIFGVIPDLQKLARAENASIYTDYMTWITTNANTLGIEAFISLGDTVESSLDAAQWPNAADAWDIMDASGIPYLICAGNHDYDEDSVATRAITNYLAAYPPARFAAHGWWNGDWYEENRPQNAYIIIRQYLFMVIEFGPRQVIIDWANDVISAHPNHRVLIFTHSHLWRDGTHVTAEDEYSPTSLGGDHDGDDLWTELLSLHSNIILVQSGHDVNAEGGPCVARRTDAGALGASVVQVLSNYQSLITTSDYLRIVAIDPIERTISQRSYNVSLGEYLEDDNNQFTEAY